MELSTQIGSDDFKALQRDVMRRVGSGTVGDRRKRMWRLVFVWLFLVIGFALLKGFGLADFQSAIVLPSLVIGLLIFLVFLGFFFQRLARYCPNQEGLILGRQKIRLTEAGIEQEGDLFSARYAWNLLEHVTETQSHLFLYMDRVAGLIVPKKYFETEDKISAFLKKITDKAPHITIKSSRR